MVFDGLREKASRLIAPKVEQTEQPQPARKRKKAQVRRFDGAKNYPFLEGLVSGVLDTFRLDLQNDLQTLRARSRDFSLNDVYMRRYIKALKNNVVGEQGIQLKMNTKNPDGSSDVLANEAIERAWSEFSREVTVCGQSLYKAQQLAIETTPRDGEMFAIIHVGRDFGKYRLQLHFVESDYLDIDYNVEKLRNGNSIVGGIEYNSFGRVVAYHFFKSIHEAPTIHNHQFLTGADRVRIEAKNVIHLFDRERVVQGRGFPWASAGLILLAQLKEYRKAELVAATYDAALNVIYKKPAGDPDDVLGDVDDDDVDPGRLKRQLEVGMSEVLPEGYDVEQLDTKHPNMNFAGFQKAVLRGFASGVSLNYNTIATDLESTSYSSLRQGAIDERDTYRAHQQWLIENLLQPLFERWLELALDFELIQVPTRGGPRPLRADLFDKYNHPLWRPRTWSWIDPAKEAAATKMRLDYKLTSRTQIARDLGSDYEDVLNEIQVEQQMADDRDIALGIEREQSEQLERELFELNEEREPINTLDE